MRQIPLQLILMVAMAVSATDLHKFNAGSPAVAQDVNDNFSRLDTAIQNRATKAGLDSANLGLKVLQTSVGAVQSSVGSLQTSKADVAGLAKKADSTWVVKSISETEKAIRQAIPGQVSLPKLLSAGKAGSGVKIPVLSWDTTGRLINVDSIGISADGIGAQVKGSYAGAVHGHDFADIHGILGAGKYTTDAPVVPLIDGNYGFSATNGITHIFSAYGVADIYSMASGKGTLVSRIATHHDVDSILGSTKVSQLANDAGYVTGAVGGANIVPKYGVTGLVPSGIYDNGTTIGLAPGGANFFNFRAWTKDNGYGALYGYVAPTDSNYLIRTTGDGSGMFINSSYNTAMCINDRPIVAATGAGATINGDLSVSGRVRFSNGTTVPADYVFEPDYKLTSLSEVEVYTKANKHLPEVPSARDMTTNGIDLAVMNMVLLKKVEELTLHAIALQKDVESHKVLLAQQQNGMAQMQVAIEALQKN